MDLRGSRVSTVNADSLSSLIGAGPLLLDFDGPLCSVFSGYSAPLVAAELVSILDSQGVAVPQEVRDEPDPIAVLRWAGGHGAAVRVAEDALCKAELRAVAVAAPTPFGHEVIQSAYASGLAIAVVSNNSAPAVRAYLAAHGLVDQVSPIIGRAYADPVRMKPEPGPVLAAAHHLGAPPSVCTLVGDSITDIQAARAAGAKVIGYANRPWKVQAFAAADAVITSMKEINTALSEAPPG
jgi:beta-phosphoglucomutase-like phosphatase (HAD superfamily)